MNTANLRPESAPPNEMNTEFSRNHFKRAVNGGGSMTSSNASLNDIGGASSDGGGKDQASRRESLTGRFFSAFES